MPPLLAERALAEGLPQPNSAFELIDRCLEGAAIIGLKKLSRNDRQWADDRTSHQAGPYLPVELRAENFFPLLKPSARTLTSHEAFIETIWPFTGERRQSRLTHYTKKGQEYHFTRVPREAFRGLSPASFLLIARKDRDDGSVYTCVTIDSNDDAYAYVEELFSVQSDFQAKLYRPEELRRRRQSELDELAEMLMAAITAGNLNELIKSRLTIPTTDALARMAQQEFQRLTGAADFNPFMAEAPGDALMRISRDIEFEMIKRYQRRLYAAQLIGILSEGAGRLDAKGIITRVVERFDSIYKLMLGSSQQLKARAGYSLEHHIRRMLKDGKVPFEEQVFIGNQRPDFILPSTAIFKDDARSKDGALVLSAKTTLRERWKQVSMEIRNCQLYLATVDDAVAGSSIEEMAKRDVVLVVPEQLKGSKVTEYEGHANVLSFKKFFSIELLAKRRSLWLTLGATFPDPHKMIV